MVNRVVQHHRAFLEEDNFVEHALHIRDEVRGQQDRGVLAVIRENGAQNVVARRRINARDRLIVRMSCTFS